MLFVSVDGVDGTIPCLFLPLRGALATSEVLSKHGLLSSLFTYARKAH